jgi:hypothetical protein
MLFCGQDTAFYLGLMCNLGGKCLEKRTHALGLKSSNSPENKGAHELKNFLSRLREEM